MTTDEIRKDLYDIRYYYAHKSLFDKAGQTIVKNTILEKTAKYNSIMENAEPRTHCTLRCTRKTIHKSWWRKIGTYRKDMSNILTNDSYCFYRKK